MKLNISPEGIDELRLFAQAYPKMVKSVIEESKADVESYLLDLIKEGTPVETGKTKRAWTSTKRKGGLSFRNPKVSAKVLDRGLYPGVGPKTVKTGSGIFSTQAPEGILNPIVKSEKVKADLANLFTEAIFKNLNLRL